MLVLSRKAGQRIVISDEITVVIQQISGKRVSIGIEAPDEVPIVRGELHAARDTFRTRGNDRASEPGVPQLRLLTEADAAELPSRAPR